MDKIQKIILNNKFPMDFLGVDLSKYLTLFDLIDSQSKKNPTTTDKTLDEYIRIVHTNPLYRDRCFDFRSSEPFDYHDPIAKFYVDSSFFKVDEITQNKIMSISIFKAIIKEYELLYDEKDLEKLIYKVTKSNKHFLIKELDMILEDRDEQKEIVKSLKIQIILKNMFK